jgi:hypothetical protein
MGDIFHLSHFPGGRFHINRARYIDPAMADKNTQLFHDP